MGDRDGQEVSSRRLREVRMPLGPSRNDFGNGRQRRGWRRRHSEVEKKEKGPQERVLKSRSRRHGTGKRTILSACIGEPKMSKRKGFEPRVLEKCRERGGDPVELFETGDQRRAKNTQKAMSRKAAGSITFRSFFPLDNRRGRRRLAYLNIKLAGKVPNRTTTPSQDVDAHESCGIEARFSRTHDECGAYRMQRRPAGRSITPT